MEQRRCRLASALFTPALRARGLAVHAISSGPEFYKVGKVAHEGVNRVSISPCERYMLTCNFRLPHEGPSVVLFWDIQHCKVLRKLDLTFSVEGEGDMMREVPNLFKWSPDGNYVARVHKDKSAAESAKNGAFRVAVVSVVLGRQQGKGRRRKGRGVGCP